MRKLPIELADLDEVISTYEKKDVSALQDAILDKIEQFEPVPGASMFVDTGEKNQFDLLNIANQFQGIGYCSVHAFKSGKTKGLWKKQKRTRKQLKKMWNTKVEPVLATVKKELCRAAKKPWEEYMKGLTFKEFVKTIAMLILRFIENPPAWILAAISFIAYYLVKFGLPRYCEWKVRNA
ncbi:MAG: hypothetical protein ABIG11_05230 [bacterium]